MAISQFIAHRIQRSQPNSESQVHARDQVFELNGRIEEIARELRLSFIKKLGKIHGRFSSDHADHPLSNWLAEYLSEKTSFVRFSHQAMQHFKLSLDTSEEVLDAYVLLVQEQYEQADDIYVYVLDSTHAMYLDGELNLSECLYLDTNQIRLAAKINLREWQNEDRLLNYISLQLWRGEKDLSDVFTHFIGFTDKADIKDETEKFLEAVESYAVQLPVQEAIETREKVVNYCLEQDKAGNRVVISELSSQVNETQEKQFANHIFKERPQLKEEIIPDRGQLRQYIRISGRNDILSMSFDSKCLGEAIVYDAETDALIINQIPSALKTRLIKHLKTKS